MAIRAALTLADIYGPGRVFLPRPSFTPYHFLPPDNALLDSISGGQLTVAGDLAVVCAGATATDWILDLLRTVGLDVAKQLIRYQGPEDLAAILRDLGTRSGSVVVQHLLPERELAVGSYWIPPRLLAALNNKANLDRLVPARHRPRREVVPREELARMRLAAPVVLKAATDLSSGAGQAVVICRHPGDLDRAAARFANCRSVVVEEYLAIRANHCVQFVITDDRIDHLGTAPQVTDDQGAYHGNWLGDEPAPADLIAVGRAVADRAARLGYRGVAGFDIVTTQDDRTLVLDLNFRLNGSTVPLLLAPGIRAAIGTPLLRFRSWRVDASGPALRRTLGVAARSGLIPLGVFDPAASPYPAAPGRVAGLLPGASRDEVEAVVQHLARLGLH
ncbi:hypothetical protein [Micromonospora sp. NPDC049891]|uniref:hypothetical protein n=1 Tax=Micromonospora sp. NPDC049891 TaxID=3155655 RepID=UPI0033D92B6A